MTLKIFVWADANCNGENIEWVELDVKGFLDFISNPQNKGRRIIKLCDPYFNEADTIYIEATCNSPTINIEYKQMLITINSNNTPYEVKI